MRGFRSCLDPGTKVRSLNSLSIMGEYWKAGPGALTPMTQAGQLSYGLLS